MKTKVCGLKYLSNILEIAEQDVDYIGFIFHKGSPRYFSDALSFDEVRQIPKQIKKTGVFVNEPLHNIFNTIAHYDLDAVQLHGKESPQDCEQLKPFVKVIKAFGINEKFDFSFLDEYQNSVNYFLFDTSSEKHGGTGKTFDHTLLKEYKLSIPFFLSGGISLVNIAEIQNFKHSQLIGYDINSKFETEPGLKDINKIKTFINSTRGLKIQRAKNKS